MLALEDVSAAYGLSQVLSGIGLRVEAGEAVALLGRNGVGKTTLLRTIIGLHAAGGGRIAMDETRIDALPAYRRARLGIGGGKRRPPVWRLPRRLGLRGEIRAFWIGGRHAGDHPVLDGAHQARGLC